MLRTAIIMRKAEPRNDALITVAAAARAFDIPETSFRRARDTGLIGSVGGQLYEEDAADWALKRSGGKK